jgi:hypothetical protein
LTEKTGLTASRREFSVANFASLNAQEEKEVEPMRRSLALMVVAVASLVSVAVAAAGPPTHITVTQQATLTNPTACGSYGVTWNINLTADIWTFFDSEGRRTKVVQQIHEENTVQNTVTGLTLREGPVNFVQTNFYDPETGVRELISIAGVSVNVRRGNEHLLDAGYLLIDGQTGDILVSQGPHPVRELLDGSFNISLALPGFCDILR